MKNSDLTTIILSVISIVIGLLALVSEELMIPIIGAFIAFISIYYISDTRKKLEENNEEIKKVNEKLKIHQDLIDIKANIKSLEKAVYKNE